MYQLIGYWASGHPVLMMLVNTVPQRAYYMLNVEFNKSLCRQIKIKFSKRKSRILYLNIHTCVYIYILKSTFAIISIKMCMLNTETIRATLDYMYVECTFY